MKKKPSDIFDTYDTSAFKEVYFKSKVKKLWVLYVEVHWPPMKNYCPDKGISVFKRYYTTKKAAEQAEPLQAATWCRLGAKVVTRVMDKS